MELPDKQDKSFLASLGPGLITGAADDDPSGIGTYSQAGAQFGYGLSWSLLFSLPFMTVIQNVAAQIGSVTGRGIAANLRRHYPRPLLWSAVGMTANTDPGMSQSGKASRWMIASPPICTRSM